jgi:plastocyanin
VSEPVLITESIRRGRRPGLAVAAAVAAVMPTAGLIAPHPALAAAASVALTQTAPCATVCLAFTPAALGVTVGATVTWADRAGVACTLRPITSPDPFFAGGRLPGYSYVVRVPGTYAYRCAEYPAVHATFTVAPAAAVAAAAPAASTAVVAKPAAAKLPKTAADAFAVAPVTHHTSGLVPAAMVFGGVVLALLISQLGGSREQRS